MTEPTRPARFDNGQKVRPVPVPVEYDPETVKTNVMIELDEARMERDRALGYIVNKFNRGQIKGIDPEDLERAARLIRTVRLLAPIIESENTGG